MKTYNGGTISALVNNIHSTRDLYVTDTLARATRYANAQATGSISTSMTQEMAESAVIMTVECEPKWMRRSEDHNTLDTCEAAVSEYKIVKVTIRWPSYSNTLYGKRGNYKNADQVVAMLQERGIEVEIL